MTTESTVLAQQIDGVLERIVGCLDGLDAEALNWRPPAPDTNSLYVIVTHVLGNAEECILEILAGRSVGRQREQEFLAQGTTAQAIAERWQRLRPELQEAMSALSAEDVERQYQHPRRGEITGRAVLLLVLKHASEHLGEAQLTRALALAR
ncbi:MAG TPA: DinB family protein [Chloroflexota bacterium]|jgi:hypothetical protein|nr:DinB family protein [Chloroflexota bacterium]